MPGSDKKHRTGHRPLSLPVIGAFPAQHAHAKAAYRVLPAALRHTVFPHRTADRPVCPLFFPGPPLPCRASAPPLIPVRSLFLSAPAQAPALSGGGFPIFFGQCQAGSCPHTGSMNGSPGQEEPSPRPITFGFSRRAAAHQTLHAAGSRICAVRGGFQTRLPPAFFPNRQSNSSGKAFRCILFTK